MRRVAWSAGLLLAWSFGIAAETPQSSLDFGVSAQVDVDATGKAHVVEMGKVSKLSSVPSLVPIAEVIAQRLHERIESWQFVAATKDGHPVSSTTWLYVSLEGSDDGHGGLAIRIRNAATGGELRDANVRGLAIAVTKAQEEGRVTVDVEYDETGRVRTVSEFESKSFEHGQFVKVADKNLRKWVLEAVKRWTFAPEKVEGQPIAGHGHVPIVLCLSDQCGIARDDLDRGGEGPRYAAVDPVVKLRSAVAGTAL